METKYGYKKDIRKPEHYVFGDANVTAPIIKPDGQWDLFLPKDEIQNLNGIEPDACTTFGTLNCVETLIKETLGKEILWSDRYLAITSGTDPSQGGNSPHTVAEQLRVDGDVYESDLPFDSSITNVEKFYFPNPVPKDLRDKATSEFLEQFNFQHDWVSDGDTFADPLVIKQALQYSPLGVAVYAWIQDADGLYFRPNTYPDCHWVCMYGYEDGKYWKIFDSYDNTHKQLEWNFGFYDIKRYSIVPNIGGRSNVGWWERFLHTLKVWFGKIRL